LGAVKLFLIHQQFSILAPVFVSSLLQITNSSFRYASPRLWNQLPSSFRQPHSVHSPHGSRHPVHITSTRHHRRSYHLLLPRPLTLDLNLICFTNLFLHSISDIRTALTDLGLQSSSQSISLLKLQQITLENYNQ